MSTLKKRDSVFKAYVLDKLYPSEKEPEVSTEEVNKKTLSKPATSSAAGDVKVYTVKLPPQGLPQAHEVEPQASVDNSNSRLIAVSSASESADTEEEEQLPRRRVRKRKHKPKAAKVGHSSGITASDDSPSKKDNNPPAETNQETHAGTVSTTQGASDAFSSLTKNQRKKRRKKRAKLGRQVQDDRLITGRATEFICDADGQGEAGHIADDLDSAGAKSAEEVKEFMEAVWRVLSSDGSKIETVISRTPVFETMVEQLANHQLPSEMVKCLNDIKTLLVLQDFHRARLKLTQLQDCQSLESGNVSLFSILTDITSSV